MQQQMVQETPNGEMPTGAVIGPIDRADWTALINTKALVKDMVKENTTGNYYEKIEKYQGIYSNGIRYYLQKPE